MTIISDLLLTVVLPAPNGCNLKCPFCAIAQRGEALEHVLESDDYVRFLTEASIHLPVQCLSIQGYEPLLPETWPTTVTLLEEADRLDLETRIVTNGTLLPQHAEELSALADTAVVSLDSSDAQTHEKLRGVEGCFELTVHGIRAAVDHFGGTDVIVGSILFPNREGYLTGMPKLLADLGVTEWDIGIFTDFQKGTSPASNRWIRDCLLRLTEEGAQHGVKVTLSDELGRLNVDRLYEDLTVFALEEESFVIRLSPNGTCSRGREILLPSAHAPWWDSIEPPHQFITRILGELGFRFE